MNLRDDTGLGRVEKEFYRESGECLELKPFFFCPFLYSFLLGVGGKKIKRNAG